MCKNYTDKYLSWSLWLREEKVFLKNNVTLYESLVLKEIPAEYAIEIYLLIKKSTYYGWPHYQRSYARIWVVFLDYTI